MSPKTCTCGARGSCVDSRIKQDICRRHYHCTACGARWSTVEQRMDFRKGIKNGASSALCGFQDAEKKKILSQVLPHLEALVSILKP